ncbi:MAG: hypothetical protein Q8K98_01675, partial [Bacteroidota bacterium]|nr:hypothetical protein [Bacteroidota bacterium]
MGNNKPTPIHEGPTNWSDALIESARPELYRMNAFRVTGLAVDATVRDISRQAERLRMMERLSSVQGIMRALPLDPPPSQEAIREAMQRLRDPERRLVDEFFWFWPHQLGESKNDNALIALSNQDVKIAKDLWIKQENFQSEANVSMHNLAVLCHCIALDMEYLYHSKPASEEEKQILGQQWRETLKRWKVLLEHEGFWSRLAARIRELDDPRLTTGAARRMRTSLPLTILMINAQLALRAAERSDVNTTKRHLQLMNFWENNGVTNFVKNKYVCKNCSGPVEKQRNAQWWCSSCLKNVQVVESEAQSPPFLVKEALRRTLKPVFERIKTFCKMANEKYNADESKGGDIA